LSGTEAARTRDADHAEWEAYLVRRRAEFVARLGHAPVLYNAQTDETGPWAGWDDEVQAAIDAIDVGLERLRRSR